MKLSSFSLLATAGLCADPSGRSAMPRQVSIIGKRSVQRDKFYYVTDARAYLRRDDTQRSVHTFDDLIRNAVVGNGDARAQLLTLVRRNPDSICSYNIIRALGGLTRNEATRGAAISILVTLYNQNLFPQSINGFEIGIILRQARGIQRIQDSARQLTPDPTNPEPTDVSDPILRRAIERGTDLLDLASGMRGAPSDSSAVHILRWQLRQGNPQERIAAAHALAQYVFDSDINGHAREEIIRFLLDSHSPAADEALAMIRSSGQVNTFYTLR